MNPGYPIEDVGLWPIIRELPASILYRMDRIFMIPSLNMAGSCGGTEAMVITTDLYVFMVTLFSNHRKNVNISVIESKELQSKPIVNVLRNIGHLFVQLHDERHGWDTIYNRQNYLFHGPGSFPPRFYPWKMLREEVDHMACNRESVFILDKSGLVWIYHEVRTGPMRMVEMQIPNIRLDENISLICCSQFEMAVAVTDQSRMIIMYDQFHLQELNMPKNVAKLKKVLFFSYGFLLLWNDGHLDFLAMVDDDNYISRFLNCVRHIRDIDDIYCLETACIMARKSDDKRLVYAISVNRYVYEFTLIFETEIKSIPDIIMLYFGQIRLPGILVTLPVETIQPSTLKSLGRFNSFNNELTLFSQVEYWYNRVMLIHLEGISLNRETLMKKAPYFVHKFLDNTPEEDSVEAKIISTKNYGKRIHYFFRTVYHYFRFLYTDELIFTDTLQIAQLYDLANKFQDNRLKDFIVDKLYNRGIGSRFTQRDDELLTQLKKMKLEQ